MRLFFAISLLTALGCSDGRELVVVRVNGSRSGISVIRALVTLDGKSATDLENFDANVSDFGLELPEGATGELDILVAGFDTHQCIVEAAEAQTQASSTDRVNLAVTLAAVVPPQCK